MIKRIVFIFLGLWCIGLVSAQRVAVKTDLLRWATTTPNIGAEVVLDKHFTVGLSWAWNPFTFSENRKLKHWMLEPEMRFYLWEPMNGHYFGLYGKYTEFNVGGIKLPLGVFPDLEDFRYEGKSYGAGLTYGYQWMLAPRWGLEASLGIGYQKVEYRQYQCRTCGLPVGPDGKPVGESPLQAKNYFGPTKAAVSLIFIIN